MREPLTEYEIQQAEIDRDVEWLADPAVEIIRAADWYQHLVTDCKAIVTERLYRSRQEVIEGWHEVGERIATDKNYQKAAKGNMNLRRKLAEDIGTSIKTLYQAIQFYSKYPDLSHACERFEEGKNISWYKITKKYLPSENGGTASPALPDGKYRVIYADPPWKYGNTMPDYMGVQDNHYETMTVKEVCELPVKDMAGDNAVLFLWVTSPILEESFQVVNAWGFKYKASFVWDKVKHVMGHYNSVRHEILLVCTRGSCQPDIQKLFDSVYSEERTEHSTKPEYFREVIDTIYPNGKRIELFARSEHDNWNTWGNEIPQRATS